MKAVITLVDPSNGNTQMTVTLDEIIISGVSVSREEGFPQPMEIVTITFGKVTWAAGGVTTSWDLIRNTGG